MHSSSMLNIFYDDPIHHTTLTTKINDPLRFINQNTSKVLLTMKIKMALKLHQLFIQKLITFD